MSNIVIKVEDIAKQYRLGQVGRKSLNQDVNRWWHLVRGKEDPYLKIGQENDRTKKGDSEYVWALQDINFEVKQGEVLGIIGRNGAGKSTLLKLLSKVTAPTRGAIKIKGRIASLLEVGTGFHPDLSGRDNIFLNGAILGMTKKEIAAKFDQIVDFAGVERYIDTPVKRYSSGMYVRLAFGVAAHLEPEILIVDEVLAVGDAEFQKKCLGKMKDVSEKDGRTVLFVSHNMEAVIKLCDKCLYLKNGKTEILDNTSTVINQYLTSNTAQPETIDLGAMPRNKGTTYKNALFKSVKIKQHDNESWKIKYRQPLQFQFVFEVYTYLEEIEFGVTVSTFAEFEVASSLSSDYKKIEGLSKGVYSLNFEFENFNLLPATYHIGFGIRSNKGFEDFLPSICQLEVLISEDSAKDKTGTRKGILVPDVSFTLTGIQ